MSKHFARALTAATILGFGWASPGLASVQQASAPGSAQPGAASATDGDQALGGQSQDEASGQTNDIVVTARKVEERLQDVPVAITAFTSRDIQSARIEDLADVAKLTPGLNFTPLFGRQNQLPIIRGAAQTFGQLNVGVFLDGIYLSGKAAVDLELNDLERIEVVRGPQSALYGRNTFAGAINYITRRPSKQLSGFVDLSAGDNGYRKAIASVGGPLSDTIRVRVGAYARDFDGFYRSAIDGGRVDFAKSRGASGTLEFQPVENLVATFRATYSKDDLGQPPSNVIRNNSSPGRPAGSPTGTVRNILFMGKLPAIPLDGVTVNTVRGAAQIGEFGDREEAIRASGTLRWDNDAIAVTSLTSYGRRDSEYTFDGDNTVCNVASAPSTTGCPNFGFPFAPGSNIPIGTSSFALSSSDGSSRDWSQELRVQSNSDGRLSWLVGAFYYDNRSETIERSFTPTAAGQAAFGFPEIITTTKSYAAFGSLTFQVTPQFALTGELRYEKEDQAFRQRPTNAAATGSSAAVFNLKQKFDFVTPRVIANYKLHDSKLLYASYARGAKTGGFNTNLNIGNDQRTYQPEYSDNFELGLKSDWFDNGLRLNVTGFYINWKDQQAACQNPLSFGGTSTQRTYVCNVAASRIYGSEVEFGTRIDRYLSVTANYTYTHARYRKFIDDSLAANLAILGQGPLNFRGKHLPYVPDHKLVVSPLLTLPAGDITFEARADVSYQSNSFLRADNLQFFGSKSVTDVRVAATRGPVRVQLFVNNLFDDDRPTAGVRFFDSVNFSLASPLVQGADRRQIGASIGYRF